MNAKWTLEEWAKGVKEFRVYGYDPYNSVDASFHWWIIGEALSWP